jgi:putative two-component system response regulator
MNGYEAIKILKSKNETKTIPVIFLTGKTDSDDELEGLSMGAVDYITKPFTPALLLKRVEIHMEMELQRKTLKVQAAELQFLNNNLERLVEEKTQNIIELKNALLKTMAEMVEFRDDVTGGHIERTQQGLKILLDIIEKKGLYREEATGWNIKLLVQSCQLHDVGKISIGDNILKKKGNLSNAEFEEMKKHTVFGGRIIEKIETMTTGSDFLKYAKIFAVSHHEKWDGSGYPHGLKGTEIPLLGRIMAVVDVYDALISNRSYKNAFGHEEAVKIIREGSETHFDPILVDLFIAGSNDFKKITVIPSLEEIIKSHDS